MKMLAIAVTQLGLMMGTICLWVGIVTKRWEIWLPGVAITLGMSRLMFRLAIK